MNKVILIAIFANLTFACTKYKVTASVLNLRSGPGTNYALKGSVNRNSVVCAVSCSGKWCKLDNGKYACNTYLQKVSGGSSSTKPSTSSSCTTMYVTASSLNVRSGPSTSSSRVSSLNQGASVSVCGYNSDKSWAQLSNKNWVSASYLTTNKPASASTYVPTGGRQDTSPRPPSVTAKSDSCVYYRQGDPRWGSKMFSNHNDYSQTYSSSACGPTSMAMVVATLADKSVTPVTMGTWAVSNGYRTYNDGTAWGFFCAIAKKYNISCTQTGSASTMFSALNSGKLAVCSMGPGYWTSGGHYIMCHSIVGDNVVCHDPAKTTRYQSSKSIFNSQGHQFWILSK